MHQRGNPAVLRHKPTADRDRLTDQRQERVNVEAGRPVQAPRRLLSVGQLQRVRHEHVRVERVQKGENATDGRRLAVVGGGDEPGEQQHARKADRHVEDLVDGTPRQPVNDERVPLR